MTQFDERAPVIIGVGEASRRTVPGDWPAPRDLAGAAITAALADCGQPQAVAAAIDTIAAIRTFEDSGISMGTGSPDNVPEAFGSAGGVSAGRLIYADIGGQSPQALVGELAGAIRRGEIEVALIVGAEANGTAKRARKAGVELDWRLPSDAPFDNRQSAFPILSRTEIRHGIISMPLAYSLLENAMRLANGRSPEQHSARMSALWAAFAQRSLAREHAQFAREWRAEELASDGEGNYRLTDIYRRWHVAQDAVDLGGAIILASAGKARALGVAPGRMVWLAGAAETKEVPYSERADLVAPAALDHALHAALDQAGLAATDLGPVDIYSCFPVAVSAAIEALRDPARASGDYTLIGGLSFFGGPGNGYALYSIAAMVEALRRDPSQPALITANGGVMSKQAVGIYTAQPPATPWSGEVAKGYMAQGITLDDAPQGNARILTFTRAVAQEAPGPASLIVELESGARAMAVWDDPPDTDLGGMRVTVTPGEKRHRAEPIG
jgi:acetyl-CoA C-acetyltransferase